MDCKNCEKLKEEKKKRYMNRVQLAIFSFVIGVIANVLIRILFPI